MASLGVRIQQNIQDTRREADSWASDLKFKEAVADVIVLPFFLVAYLIGLIWFIIKYVIGILVHGFKKGARTKQT